MLQTNRAPERAPGPPTTRLNTTCLRETNSAGRVFNRCYEKILRLVLMSRCETPVKRAKRAFPVPRHTTQAADWSRGQTLPVFHHAFDSDWTSTEHSGNNVQLAPSDWSTSAPVRSGVFACVRCTSMCVVK